MKTNETKLYQLTPKWIYVRVGVLIVCYVVSVSLYLCVYKAVTFYWQNYRNYFLIQELLYGKMRNFFYIKRGTIYEKTGTFFEKNVNFLSRNRNFFPQKRNFYYKNINQNDKNSNYLWGTGNNPLKIVTFIWENQELFPKKWNFLWKMSNVNFKLSFINAHKILRKYAIFCEYSLLFCLS